MQKEISIPNFSDISRKRDFFIFAKMIDAHDGGISVVLVIASFFALACCTVLALLCCGGKTGGGSNSRSAVRVDNASFKNITPVYGQPVDDDGASHAVQSSARGVGQQSPQQSPRGGMSTGENTNIMCVLDSTFKLT